MRENIIIKMFAHEIDIPSFQEYCGIWYIFATLIELDVF